MAYEHVFEPIRLNNLVLKNRIIAAAGISAGDVHNAEAVSKGGVSMVVTCMMDVDCPKSYFYPDTPYSFGKGNYLYSQRDHVKTKIKRVHQGGALYAVELDHVGEYHRAKKGDFAWGAVDKISSRGVPVKAMDQEAMNEVAAAYARTSRDVLELGYDAILFDCGAGWLMAQFLSPHYNKRADAFGGPIENRAKFPLQVIQEMRKAVGRDKAILCVITANEFFDDGISFEDVTKFLQMVEPYVDGVLVGCGNDQNHLQLVKGITTNLEPHLFSAGYTETLKKALHIPVILGGAIMTPDEAEQVLATGKADMIAMCRPLIADPNLLHKMQYGQEEDIVPCLRCNYCYHVSTDYKNLGCSVNPYYTQQPEEYLSPIRRAKTRRRVVVAGAGPAGIRAALAADGCGHEVILLEKEAEVGGLLRYIEKEKYKCEVAAYLKYLKAQLAKSNIDIRLNTKATKELLEEMAPDKLVIAIGADDIIPPIPGREGSHVHTACEAIMLDGELGNRIAVIGGGTVGAELALDLADRSGREIVIIELSDKLAASANEFYYLNINDHIRRADNIRPYMETMCVEIGEDYIVIEAKGHSRQKLPVDDIVISAGMRAKTQEALTLFGSAKDTVLVGCANKPGNIIEATYEGHASGVNVL